MSRSTLALCGAALLAASAGVANAVAVRTDAGFQANTLARNDDGPRRGDWQFSREAVGQVEAMFRAALDLPVAPDVARWLAAHPAATSRPIPSLWLRGLLPAWLRN